jgi:GTP-binding protein Era
MKQDEIEMLIKKFEEKKLFSNVIPISAEEKYNLESVLNSILEILPVHPKYYPDDQLSDENERFFVTEIIREKIFELYREEVPYSTEVIIDEFKERETGKDYILASIVVERESQKPIIIGNKGEAIKRLGQIARRAVEEFLGKEVFLELNVKVKEKWRSDKNILRQFGYDTHHE